VLPRRWVVERTLAWLNRNRRLAKDFEASLASAKAWLYLGSIQLLIRRLETFADSPVLVIPAHFPTPSAGWIRSHAESFRFHFDRLG
jgi:hypothetical protein